MILTFQYILSTSILITLGLSAFYAIRYRRHTDPIERGILSARMNICMGLMLILLSVTQLFFFTDTAVRRVIATIFILIGLFNLYSGIRNHGAFSRKKQLNRKQS